MALNLSKYIGLEALGEIVRLLWGAVRKTGGEQIEEKLKQHLPSLFPSLDLKDNGLWLGLMKYLRTTPKEDTDRESEFFEKMDDATLIGVLLAQLPEFERRMFPIVVMYIPTKVTTEIMEIGPGDARVLFLQDVCAMLRERGYDFTFQWLFVNKGFGDDISRKLDTLKKRMRSAWKEGVHRIKEELLSFFEVDNLSYITPAAVNRKLTELDQAYRRVLGLPEPRRDAEGRPEGTIRERQGYGLFRSLLPIPRSWTNRR